MLLSAHYYNIAFAPCLPSQRPAMTEAGPSLKDPRARFASLPRIRKRRIVVASLGRLARQVAP
jgi:hypothetical protein